MKFLTPALIHGDYDGKTSRRIWQEYRDYLAEIAPLLPLEFLTLADIEVHDAKIRQVIWYPRKQELLVRLRCGWIQIGYFDLNLHYFGVTVNRSELGVWKALARREIRK